MKFILPMAGEGSRFKKIGLDTPKPLLRLANQELLLHALSSLPICDHDTLIFISLKSDKVKERILPIINQRYHLARIEWIEIDAVTRGQLCTVLLAKEFIDTPEPILIHNCDTYFRSDILALVDDKKCDGALSCFKAEGEHWSFARVNHLGEVLETAEKHRISDWASVGAYYFANGSYFVTLAEDMVYKNERVNNEFYIAPLYNAFIKNGKRILLDRVYSFKGMGTPDDVKQYWGVDLSEFIKNNVIPKTIVMDLDGTICSIKEANQSYSDVHIVAPVIEKMKELKRRGYRIVIHTARQMRTHNHNVGAILASVGEETMRWLRTHGVPFDEIVFGKPWGRGVLYIDDRALRPTEFVSMTIEDLEHLIDQEQRVIEAFHNSGCS